MVFGRICTRPTLLVVGMPGSMAPAIIRPQVDMTSSATAFWAISADSAIPAPVVGEASPRLTTSSATATAFHLVLHPRSTCLFHRRAFWDHGPLHRPARDNFDGACAWTTAMPTPVTTMSRD